MGLMDLDYDENKSAIKRVLDDLEESNITFENYKRYIDKVENTINVISAQIENDRSEYENIYGEYKEMTEGEIFKRTKLDNVVPLDAFKQLINITRVMKDTLNWEMLKSGIYQVMYKKLLSVTNDANALDIKRDALEEMREMEKERNKVILEVIGQKAISLDQRYDFLNKQIYEQHRSDKKELLYMMENIIGMVLDAKKGDEDLKKYLKEVEEKRNKIRVDEVTPPAPEPVKEPVVDDDDEEEYVPEVKALPEKRVYEPGEESIEDIERKFEERGQ